MSLLAFLALLSFIRDTALQGCQIIQQCLVLKYTRARKAKMNAKVVHAEDRRPANHRRWLTVR
jgi:hypothetical protein